MSVRFKDIARRAKNLSVNKHWQDVEHNAKEIRDGASLVWSDLRVEFWSGFDLPDLSTSVSEGRPYAHLAHFF